MVAETATAAAAAEVLFQQTISTQYQVCVPQPVGGGVEIPSPSSISIQVCRTESVFGCSPSIQGTPSLDTKSSKFFPNIRSGSHTDTGPRRCNEDEHIQMDDISAHLGDRYRWPLPSSFYAVFDGHGGSDAASYVKNNAVKFFLNDAMSLKNSFSDESFFEELERSQRRAFLQADQALADECSIDACCGTTALTALVIGKHLVVANAGDCRAVLCRKGIAVQMSQDHRPSSAHERKRVEELGGSIEYGYLNGELSVTRALGDMFMKHPYGSSGPLTAEPEVQHALLTEEDEFLILGCDGIWDVISNQEAVSLVRRHLRLHNDPQLCAKELVKQALCRDTSDNLTVIVVCFTSQDHRDLITPQRSRLRHCCLSDEARLKLRSLFECN